MSTYVFVGPTISIREASGFLNATYLPPAAQGDIASLLRRQPHIIGIIDGYFESVPSIWHKEILLALSQGVHVVGAASLGALRAVELARFGMVGIGEIFRWYRDGMIEADDEVAIRHASQEHDYRGMSEALVNMRQTFRLAHERAIVSSSTAETLLAIGKQLHYTERLYQSVLEQGAAAGLPAEEIAALRAFLKDHRVDQKKLDAIEMLEHIAELQKSDARPAINFELQHTTRLDELMDKDICLDPSGEVPLTPEMLVGHCRSDGEEFKRLHDRAASNRLMLDLAQQLGVTVSDAEIQAGAKEFHESFGLMTDEDATEWMRRNQLTIAERERLIGEWLLIKKMKASFPPDNRDVIRQLRLEGKYEAALARCEAGSSRRG
jgi:hypothetical protein